MSPGVHINAVDVFTPTTRELDTTAVARSRPYVDRRESTVNEAGEYLIPLHEGAIQADHIVGEIGPAQMLEARLTDEKIRRLAQRVEVTEADDLNELSALFQKGDPRGRFASRVNVAMTDGRVYRSGLVGGDLSFPQPGWDEDVMEAKFRWLATTVLESAQVDRLVEMLWHFDEITNAREFTQLVAG